MTAIALTDLMKSQQNTNMEEFNTLVDLHRGFFPEGMSYVKLSEDSAYFISCIHNKAKWANGIEHNDPMRTMFTIDKIDEDKYIVELYSGESLSVAPAPGSIYAFDSVPCKFRKSRGNIKAVFKKIREWEEKRFAIVIENMDKIK